MKNRKIMIIVATSWIILIIALILEVFLFNNNYFVQGNKEQKITDITSNNLELIGNGNYKILENDAGIQLNNINGFVNKLEFKTDSFEKNINIKIAYNGKVLNDNINSTNKKSITIGENVDNIQISFLNAKDQEIFIDNFQNMNYFQFNPFRLMMVLLFFLLMSIIIYAIYKKGNFRIEVVFLILILCFGSANAIMTPVFYSWDEPEHFVKSYNLASGNLVMSEGEVLSYPVGMKEFLSKKHQILRSNYRSFEEYKNVMNSLIEINYSNSEMAYYPSTAIPYTAIPYVFSAMGILIGKLLSFPFIWSFYLGRLFNLGMYATLVFFALKHIPVGKKLLFVCALLPTIFFQAATFSADVVLNSFSFLVFSIIIKWLFDQKRLAFSDLCIIGGCFIFITASKATYAPIFLMVLIFKNKNFSNKKHEWLIKFGVLLIGLITFVSVFLYGKQFGIAQWGVPGVNVKDQILSIIFNPINFLGVIFRTIVTQGQEILRGASMFLGFVGHFGNASFIFIWLGVLFIAAADITNQSSLLVMRDKGIILLMCFLTLALSMTALYVTFTPLGYDVVYGFQGRYLIPIIFPVLFLFQRKYFIFKIDPNMLNIVIVIFSGGILFKVTMFAYILYYV